MTKYRIVTDKYQGFEVQKKLWWWPIWIQNPVNTHSSLECAEKYARNLATKNIKKNNSKVVKNLGEWKS